MNSQIFDQEAVVMSDDEAKGDDDPYLYQNNFSNTPNKMITAAELNFDEFLGNPTTKQHHQYPGGFGADNPMNSFIGGVMGVSTSEERSRTQKRKLLP